MNMSLLSHAALLLLGVFVSAISQVMLKKAAMREYASPIQEYLNPLVIFAYVLFVGTTILSILAYRVVPLSMGPVLEATSYLYVTFFGATIFRERITKRKLLSLAVIILGISLYSIGL